MPARRLILIKHSHPQIDRQAPADEWPLSEEGRHSAARLAERLLGYRPQRLYTSPEPKAAQTAAILGERLSLSATAVPALHEHLRHSAPYGTPQEFEASIQALFTLPDRLVFGEETAHQAQARFTRAVQDIADAHPNQIVIIVAHGTVISLHLSAALHWTPLQTFTFWKRLELSGGVVVEGRIIIEEISL